MAGRYPKNSTEVTNRSRSKVTGKKFNRQSKDKNNYHGAQHKRKEYQKAIETTINSSYMDDWKTAEQIAYEATKQISNHWKQISSYVLSSIMRIYTTRDYVSKRKEKVSSPVEYRRRNIIPNNFSDITTAEERNKRPEREE